MPKILLLPFIFLCFYSCAPSRFVKPLNKKQQAVDLALGGPLIAYKNVTIPTPFFTATYGYGISNTLTGFGSLNITSAMYGNFQIELGGVKRISRQKNLLPAISITPVANIIYRNKDANKVYPQLDINAYWNYNKGKGLFYIGLSNWFELAQTRAFDVKQPNHWLPSPMIGQTFIRRKFNFTIEVKVIAPNISYLSNTVDYTSPLGKHGAFGFYLGYTRKLKSK
jgi:hypothetical protein